MTKPNTVPIWHKYALTIQEAADYYGIGEKRIRSLVSDHVSEPFILEIGSQIRIKRELFEDYLNQASAV